MIASTSIPDTLQDACDVFPGLNITHGPPSRLGDPVGHDKLPIALARSDRPMKTISRNASQDDQGEGYGGHDGPWSGAHDWVYGDCSEDIHRVKCIGTPRYLLNEDDYEDEDLYFTSQLTIRLVTNVRPAVDMDLPLLPSNLSIPAFASSRVHHELASSRSPKMPCRMLRVPDFVDPPETYRPFQTHDKDEEVLYVWANGENYVVAHADLSVIWDEWGQVPYLHTDFFSALPSRKSSPVYSPSTPTSSLSASDSFNPQWLSASPDQESGGEMKDLPESLVAALTKLRLASSDGMIPFSEVALRQLVKVSMAGGELPPVIFDEPEPKRGRPLKRRLVQD